MSNNAGITEPKNAPFPSNNGIEQVAERPEVVLICNYKTVIGIIPHPDGERCITLGSDEAKMFSLRSQEHLVDFEVLIGSKIKAGAI